MFCSCGSRIGSGFSGLRHRRKLRPFRQASLRPRETRAGQQVDQRGAQVIEHCSGPAPRAQSYERRLKAASLCCPWGAREGQRGSRHSRPLPRSIRLRRGALARGQRPCDRSPIRSSRISIAFGERLRVRAMLSIRARRSVVPRRRSGRAPSRTRRVSDIGSPQYVRCSINGRSGLLASGSSAKSPNSGPGPFPRLRQRAAMLVPLSHRKSVRR